MLKVMISQEWNAEVEGGKWRWPWVVARTAGQARKAIPLHGGIFAYQGAARRAMPNN